MTRRKAIVLVVLALAGTIIIESDVLIRRVAVQRAEEILDGCVHLSEPTVDLGGRPAALRALRGHLDGLTFAADSAEIAGVRLAGIDGHIRRVRFRILGGLDTVEVDDADVAVRLDQRDLEALLADLGIDGSAHIDDNGVAIRLDGMPAAIELDVTAEDGAAVISPTTAVLQPLMQLRFDIPGVSVRHIDTADGSLHIDATATGHPRQIACQADEIVSTRLQAFSQLARLLPG
jgi:hypothetical protein